MAESSTLVSQCRDLLVSSSHERFELFLNQISNPQEPEHQSALSLYGFCLSKFPNCLTQTLLKLYQSSSNETTRFQSLNLLSSTFETFRSRKTHLSLQGLYEIKPLLISCLEMQESELKILTKIVSFVTYDVVSLDNNGWDELSECILSFAKTQPLKAFLVFNELPRVYWRFIERFMEKIIEEAKRVLLKPENVEDWSLGLVTLVKMGIQILDSETRMDLVWRLLSFIVEVVSEVVQLDMEEFVVLGLEYLESFLFRDKDFYGYINNQWKFVSSIMYKIREFGSKITEAARRIHRFVRSGNEDPQENEDRGESGNANISDRECFEHLNSLSLLEIVGIFASDGQEEKYKDMVIRRIQLLLSDENRNKAEIDVSVMRKLQPLLVSCLTKGVSESMFKVLGEVVYHVAYEMMHVRDETWIGLRDYLVAQSKTEFQRAVYIFQCLKMPLDEQEFVIPVMESLLPEINTRLNPPSEVLVDNSGWVLAFTGAFCAVIHLIEVEDSAESVKDIAYKMIGSVRELVEKGMEVGLVMRAFRDVESIVKKHLEWFTTNEYKFVKGMVRRLSEIKGMKMECKMVLWRINVVVERGVRALFKGSLGCQLDWLNEWC